MTSDTRALGQATAERLPLRARMPRPETIFMVAVAAVLLVVIIVPLLKMVLIGFLDRDTQALTLGNFQTLLASPRAVEAIRNTVLLALGSGILASLLGISLAWITARTDSPFSNQFELLNIMPFFLSTFVGALAWRFLLSPNIGVLNRFFEDVLRLPININIYGLGGMIWVVSLYTTPYAYMFAIASFRKMDPALEEAARVCGMNALQTALKITLPLSTPAILSGALFAFILAAGMLEVPLALGLPENVYTLSMEIWQAVQQYPANLNLGAAVALMIVGLTIVGVYIQRRIILPRSFVTVAGKGWRPTVVRLGRWRYVTFAFNLLYVLVTIIFPFGVLLMVSFSRVWTGEPDLAELTLQNYHTVFTTDETSRGIKNSLILAVSSASIGALLAVVLSYTIFRTRLPGRGLLDFLVTVPIAVPGVALGVAILSTWIATPLYQTLAILLLAYISRWLPICQKNVASVLLAVSPELDECARVSGASWLQMMKRIMLPLLRPGIVAAWLMLFIISIREMSASLLLYHQGTEVMSVALWLMIQKDMPTVAAFAMVQTLLLLTSALVFTRLVGRDVSV